MIKFNIRESINDPGMIFLTWTIYKETKVNSRKVPKSLLTNTKNSIVRQEVINMCDRLFKWRNANFSHSGYSKESAILALIELERLIPSMHGIHNLKSFFDFTVTKVIPQLHEIAPGVNSKYKNYRPALDELEDFSLKCQEYFTKQEIDKNFAIINGQSQAKNSINNNNTHIAESQRVKELDFQHDLFSVSS